MLHKQKFAINFVTTPFWVEMFFSYITQAKVCHNFFYQSPFLVESFFSYATQAKVCINFVATPFLVKCFASSFYRSYIFFIAHTEENIRLGEVFEGNP